MYKVSIILHNEFDNSIDGKILLSNVMLHNLPSPGQEVYSEWLAYSWKTITGIKEYVPDAYIVVRVVHELDKDEFCVYVIAQI